LKRISWRGRFGRLGRRQDDHADTQDESYFDRAQAHREPKEIRQVEAFPQSKIHVMIHNMNWPGNPSSIDILRNLSKARRWSFKTITHVNTRLGDALDWLS
jgi:hypothetical protein